MTGGAADLVNFENHSVQVAVHQNFLDQLGIAGFFAFFPEFVSGTGPVSRLAALQRFIPGFLVDIGKHQHIVGFPVLRDGGNQSAAFLEIKFDHVFLRLMGYNSMFW